MALKFTDKREITDVSQLTEIQKRQLEEVATKYDGNYLSAEMRLEKLEQECYNNKGELGFSGHCYHWRVTDFNDTYLYDAWLYMVDFRTFFNANSTEKAGL
ncbi:hypothetical protein [Aquimarina algiphila]|uniref:hypothetical protein n=1 Tax=Aquimarina algiphila TaxID=2047982 RepID=UPI00232C5046|nr:hypothetical protein [Aquimarina algiphila]